MSFTMSEYGNHFGRQGIGWSEWLLLPAGIAPTFYRMVLPTVGRGRHTDTVRGGTVSPYGWLPLRPRGGVWTMGGRGGVPSLDGCNCR